MTVKQLVKTMDDEENVVVLITAYGVHYADSYADGMRTAKDIKEKMNYTCINAKVTSVKARKFTDLTDGTERISIIIGAEICK